MKLRIREDKLGTFWLERRFFFTWWSIACAFTKERAFEKAKNYIANKNKTFYYREWTV